MTTDSDFAQYLAVLRAGFEMRAPDARERAERARDRYLKDVRRAWFHRTYQHWDEWGHHAARAREAEDKAIAINNLVVEFRHANLDDGRKGAATAESTVRPKPSDAIGRLRRAGRLSHEQERWALEIARVFEALCGSLMARGRPLAMMGGGKGIRLEFGVERTPEFILRLHHDYYLPWIQAMHARHIPRSLVIDVVVFGVSLHQIKKQYRIGWERALKALVAALDLYGKVKGGWHRPLDLGEPQAQEKPPRSRQEAARKRRKKKAAHKVPKIELGGFKHAYKMTLDKR